MTNTEAIVLDTPEEINMWVLLSRRHQVQLHLKGVKVPGIVKWVKENLGEGYPFPIRTARDCIVPIEYAISQAGGEVDYNLVNIHVLAQTNNPSVFQDYGVYDSPADINPDSHIASLYVNGQAEVVLTLEDPRPPTGELFIPA